MDLPFTKELLEILYIYVMVGIHQAFNLFVPVQRILLWIMLCINCPNGGYPTIRHNQLHDFTGSLLLEVCFNVCTYVSVKPQLQHLTGESFPLASANVEDGACLDVAASSFGRVIVKKFS